MTIRYVDSMRDMIRAVCLYQCCFGEPPWNERFDPVELRSEFEEILTWPDAIFLVAEDQDGLVIGGAIGFSVCRKPDVCQLIPPMDRNSFYVAELFVDPAARVRGVCRAMNESLLRRACSRGFTRSSVRTSVDQTIIQHLFVDGLGFKVVATQEVVSTKWIDEVETQVPDTRVLMTGGIPDYGAIARECESRVVRGGMCEH